MMARGARKRLFRAPQMHKTLKGDLDLLGAFALEQSGMRIESIDRGALLVNIKIDRVVPKGGLRFNEIGRGGRNEQAIPRGHPNSLATRKAVFRAALQHANQTIAASARWIFAFARGIQGEFMGDLYAFDVDRKIA